MNTVKGTLEVRKNLMLKFDLRPFINKVVAAAKDVGVLSQESMVNHTMFDSEMSAVMINLENMLTKSKRSKFFG